MSEKKTFRREVALVVANELVSALAPFCEIIEIAGSLRRWKSQVGDIEILFVPRLESRQKDFFSKEPINLADEEIGRLLTNGTFAKRPSKIGVFTWGKNNKLATHLPSGIPVDLFCESDLQEWPRSLAIRTGPKEFNIQLMSTAPKNGYTAHAYGESLHKIPSGERVISKNEREFIELCGVVYKEPQDR
jgi:DNA polymerase/3'-5' exonuclease PolX